MAAVRVVVWNVQWRLPQSEVGRAINDVIRREQADLVFLIEGHLGSLELNEIASHPNYGYGVGRRRKALLYSSAPWSDAATMADSSMPSGRFVSGRTAVNGVDILCCAVCVPWKMAHVSSGRRDRHPWEDHRLFLEGFSTLELFSGSMPTIVAGDFNQHLPRRTAPLAIHDLLVRSMPTSLRCITSGRIGGGHHSIDHIFVSHHFKVSEVRTISNIGPDGRRLSDHVGLAVDLSIS